MPRPASERADIALCLLRREADHVDHTVEWPGVGHLPLERREIVAVAVQSARAGAEAGRRLAAIVEGHVVAAACQ